MSKFIYTILHAGLFSTLFSNKVVLPFTPQGSYDDRGGGLRLGEVRCCARIQRCSGGHPPERSGSHSWSSSLAREGITGGVISARAGGCRARSADLCMCGPGYRHSNPRVQSRLDRELFQRGV